MHASVRQLFIVVARAYMSDVGLIFYRVLRLCEGVSIRAILFRVPLTHGRLRESRRRGLRSKLLHASRDLREKEH